MKSIRPGIFFIVLLMTLATGGGPRRTASLEARHDNENRISFRVVAVEEEAGNRNVISESVIEGPPGTDFNINLQASRFKMEARFLTDLVATGVLKVRAKLETRRFHGYSENHLPLYEEDRQSHSLDLGFDEEISLLPFGYGGDQMLRIEITPSVTDKRTRLPSGGLRPLEINIVKQSPGGSINVEAFKRPHKFEVEAALFEDGREVASTTANCLLEEAQELILLPNERAGAEVTNNTLAVSFTVSQYLRGRPADEAAISFDMYRIARARGDSRETVANNWAGIAALGHGFKYDLGDLYLNDAGKKYEIRFSVRLAKGEAAD